MPDLGERDLPGSDNAMEGLDAIIENAFSATAEDSPTPTADEADDDPQGDDLDNPPVEDDEEEPEDDLEDDDADEAGDEESEDFEDEEEDDDEELSEDEDEEDEDEEDDDEEEDVLESISKEDLEAIESDPRLRKVHKSMQAGFTQKMTALSERMKTVEELENELDGFNQTLRTAEGMATHIARVMEVNPMVVGAAFERAATGDRAEGFLVEVGLTNPEVLEKAFDRVQELLQDEGAKSRYDRERTIETQKQDLAARENRLRRKNFDRDIGPLMETAGSSAAKYGLVDKEDVQEVRTLLHEKIRANVQNDGSIKLAARDVREIVKGVKAKRDRIEARVRARLEKKQAKTSQARAKKKATSRGKKKTPPKSAGRKPPKERTKFQPEEGRDGIDSFVDFRLGPS